MIAKFSSKPWLMLKVLTLIMLMAVRLESTVRPASAHGIGTIQLVSVPAGPYLIWAWTDPDPLRTDQMHVTVAVTEVDTQTIIPDAIVTVRIDLPDSNVTPLIARATSDASSNKFVYVATLEPSTTGQWHTTISVEGAAGSGSANFMALVLPPQGFNWQNVAGPGIVVLIIGWFAWSLRPRESSRRDGR